MVWYRPSENALSMRPEARSAAASSALRLSSTAARSVPSRRGQPDKLQDLFAEKTEGEKPLRRKAETFWKHQPRSGSALRPLEPLNVGLDWLPGLDSNQRPTD